MRVLLGSLLLSASFLVLAGQPARGCAKATRKGDENKVQIASESALIIWDEKTKTQHFIRRAAFESRVPYFGFLVPTPNEPKLAEAPNKVFDLLEDWTKPEVKTVYDFEWSLLDFRMSAGLDKGTRGKGGSREEPVEVLARYADIAGFDAVVLKASDPRALRDWLEKHGYDARPQLIDWVAPYVEKGWIVTAFQIAKKDRADERLSPQAVRMSFKTDRPFFPYREPAEARERPDAEKDRKLEEKHRQWQSPRLLRLFIISGQRMEGKLGDGKTQWPGRAVWANPLRQEQRGKLQDLLGDEAAVSEEAWLTVLDDHASVRPGTDDLFFTASAAQDTLQRPPLTRHQTVSLELLAGLGVLLLIVLPLVLLWRRRRPKADVWKKGTP
jgi:hypothetical protein